ncbi:unnamed protein product [Leuciscus chuanchicus]
MTSTFSHAIKRPGANVRKGSDEGPAVKTLEMEASPLGISAALFSWQVVVLLGYSYRACDSFSAEELGSRDSALSPPRPGFDSRSGNELLPSSGGRDCKMPHYKLKRRGARPRKCLRVKKTSFEPESNQRPKDCQLATYSPPLYQLSYRRNTGRGQNFNPPGR